MKRIKKLLHRNIYPIISLFLPINKNKVVFSSYYGRQYSDNPRAISETLHEQDPEIEIVWLMNNVNKARKTLPEYIKVVKNDSFLASYELYTAKVWVDNCRKLLFFKKRKKQTYIQTWHGTPLKLIEGDAEDKLETRYKTYARRDTNNIDLLISGNTYSTPILKRSFFYKGEVAEIGTPRNDLFFKDIKLTTQKVREFYNLSDDKIILYAPTFRNELDKNGLNQLDELDPKTILEEFKNSYSSDCVLLYRFHPNVAQKIDEDMIKQKYGDKIINGSAYPDMQELLVAADTLITDYSSSFFDYALLKRPIFLFIYDYEDYSDERGLYLELDQLPFNIAKSSQELRQQIINMSLTQEKIRGSQFLEIIGNADNGKASDKIVNYIKSKI